MEKKDEMTNESQPQETFRIEEGESRESGSEKSGLSKYYIANATLTPVEGGHLKLRFQVLHKETDLPGGPNESMFMFSFDKWKYCMAGHPGADGWHESVQTPAQPGPTYVNITTQGTCPITDPDHITVHHP